MKKISIEGIPQKQQPTLTAVGHKMYPYLVRQLNIERPNHVRCCNFTYVPMCHGLIYHVVVKDWVSRHVIGWRFTNSTNTDFCVEALADAFSKATPKILNTGQGSQFTDCEFTNQLKDHGVAFSIDGKCGMIDNVMINRLCQTVSCKDIYLKG